MPFTWVQDISVGAIIDAADLNEVKTNLDTIYTALSITRTGCGAGAGWVELPVSAGGVTQTVDFQELRAVTDYAYDNRCPIHDVADNSPVNAAVDSGVDNDDHGTYNSGYDSAEHIDDHGTYNLDYDSAEHIDDHGGYNSSYLDFVLSNYHDGYFSSAHCSAVNTAV